MHINFNWCTFISVCIFASNFSSYYFASSFFFVALVFCGFLLLICVFICTEEETETKRERVGDGWMLNQFGMVTKITKTTFFFALFLLSNSKYFSSHPAWFIYFCFVFGYSQKRIDLNVIINNEGILKLKLEQRGEGGIAGMGLTGEPVRTGSEELTRWWDQGRR